MTDHTTTGGTGQQQQDEIDRVFEALGSPVMGLTELAEERGWDEDDLEAALGAARAMAGIVL